MATDEKYRTIIQRLLAGTTAGRLVWQRSEGPNYFVLDFPEYLMGISREYYNVSILTLFRWDAGADKQRLDSITSAEYPKLTDLYELARRQALDTDEQIDKLLLVLESYDKEG